MGGTQGASHQIGETQHELAFDHILGHYLMAGMGVAVGGLGPAISQLHVPQQEYPFPRHQNVIEKYDGVHFLEPGAQRMIEMGAAQVKTLPAEKLHPRRVAGQGKSEGVAVSGIAGQSVGPGRIDNNLVGKRAEGSQHPRAVDDNAGVGFLDHRQGHIGTVLQGGGQGRAAALQVDQGMGKGKVVLPDVFIVVFDILFELRAVLAAIVAGRRH